MANTYCHDEYCDPTHNGNPNAEISDTVRIIGYVLFMIALAAMVLYGASTGIYIDPASLI